VIRPSHDSVAPASVRSESRRELGAFLRSRRARVRPADVGLPEVGRRRTPGLRREEVAQLAGVGVTWYTWLEQGRPINASEQVVDAVARVLRLDDVEHRHLLALAGHGRPPASPVCETVAPEHLALLDQMSPFPACIQGSRYEQLAYTRSYRFLFGDLAAHPVEDQNCAWLIFTDPEWRSRYLDHDTATADIVRRLRASLPDHLADPQWAALVERLRGASATFRDLWERQDVSRTTGPVRRLRTEVGVVTVTFQSLWFDRARDVRFVVNTPVDAESTARLHELDALHAEAPRLAGRAAPSEAAVPAR